MIPSLTVLRDLPLRLALSPDLAARLKDFVTAASGAEAQRPTPAQGVALVEECLSTLDGESTRLAEQRFSLGDPMTLKQKLVLDPKRQADQLLAALKQKLSGERSEWTRRTTRQASDFQESLAKPLAAVEFSLVPASDREQTLGLSDAWATDFQAWWATSLDGWAKLVDGLLDSRTDAAIASELKALGELLERPLPLKPTPVPPMTSPARGAMDFAPISARFEVPGGREVILESFKGGLYGVAMVSGMVIIPLLTVFLKEQSPMLRAGVTAAAVIPTAAFAVINGRKTRSKLVSAAADKHRDKLKRELETLLKQRVDRFRADAERHAHAWLVDRQRDLLAVLEPLVTTVFDERERGLASQLARTQLDSERFADQLGQLRQIKTNLTAQVLVDLRRLAG